MEAEIFSEYIFACWRFIKYNQIHVCEKVSHIFLFLNSKTTRVKQY